MARRRWLACRRRRPREPGGRAARAPRSRRPDLLSDLDLDALARAVSVPGHASASGTPLAVRLRLATAPLAPGADTPGASLPSAELVLVAWREAELGCP